MVGRWLLVVVLATCTAANPLTNASGAEPARVDEPAFDVLVYGSTPGGVMAAVAAARHGASTALLSQRAHVGGVCSGGLGETDVGSCADEVVGGLALEFFKSNAAEYPGKEPRAPWNLEPHVAKRVFLRMLNRSGVTMLDPAQVVAVRKEGTTIQTVTVDDGKTYSARVFVDASYEGDLMARSGVTYTWGRESIDQYNESGAGSGGPGQKYGYMDTYLDPYAHDGSLLPLLRKEVPLPAGQADRQIQAYNFRLCVTDNATLRVPFTKPAAYKPAEWELLRRFWVAWPNSTSKLKRKQAIAPSAILGPIPSTTGARKFDMNNCGFNPIHTDMVGGSWEYPEANYSYREQIWQAHVAYTKGFLWFMSSDSSVPNHTRSAYADTWGYCGDEFEETEHFPAQLYIREARRLVGDNVFTQQDAQAAGRTPLGNLSVGMGCYGFDSHCEERFACANKTAGCTQFPAPYMAIQCGVHASAPGVYQMPVTLLYPKRKEATNLLVPVCSSASHVAYATVRMEPQFMILGHAAGVVAALAVKKAKKARTKGVQDAVQDAVQGAVQDVDTAVLAATLLADGQILELPPQSASYSCAHGEQGDRCLVASHSSKPSNGSHCGGNCTALGERTWLALKTAYFPPTNSSSPPYTLVSHASSILKKSEIISRDLPPWAQQAVGVPHGKTSVVLSLSAPASPWDGLYYLVTCAKDNCTAQ